jgi:ectoine hydroxylase-related dioxygenase (phytanoyl-CoA dioxygenase family)
MPLCADAPIVYQVAGSHLTPRVPHGTSEGGDNMLSISQDIDPVHFDESAIVDLVLEPGQASFHHGWVIHGSRPNPSNRRRLGITCIFAPGEIAYDTVSADEATRKSMHSALSSTTTGQGDQTKKPWSEGYLVKGTGGASAVKPLRHPFPYEAPKL